MQIPTKLDVVMGPEVVARLMLDQFEKGAAPEDGLLRAYRSNGENHVTQLTGAFAAEKQSAQMMMYEGPR